MEMDASIGKRKPHQGNPSEDVNISNDTKNDESSADWNSINLLDSPGGCSETIISCDDSKREKTPIPSPATQTLNQLSQNTFDLHLPPKEDSQSQTQNSKADNMDAPKSRRKSQSTKKRPKATQTKVSKSKKIQRSPEHYTRKSIPILYLTEDNEVVNEFTSIRNASTNTGEKRGDIVLALQNGTSLHKMYFRYKDPTLSSCQKPKKAKSSGAVKHPAPQESDPFTHPRKSSRRKRSSPSIRPKKKVKSSSVIATRSGMQSSPRPPSVTKHTRDRSLGSAASLLVDFKRSKSPETLDPELQSLARSLRLSPSISPLLIGTNVAIPDPRQDTHSLLARQIQPYRMHRFVIPPNSSGEGLGVTVTNSKPPSCLKAWTSGCRVSDVDETSWAAQHGLALGDWIWDTQSSSLLLYQDFLDLAHKWAGQATSNLTVSVLRLDEASQIDPIESQWTVPSQRLTPFSPLAAPSPVAAAAGAIASKLSPLLVPSPVAGVAGATAARVSLPSIQTTFTSVPASSSLVRPKAVAIPSAKKTQSNKSVSPGEAPFCKKCNGGKTKAHHSWCPKSVHYGAGGGRDIMRRISQGVKLNCAACLSESQQGKLLHDRIHSEDCLANQLLLSEKAASNSGGTKAEGGSGQLSKANPQPTHRKTRPWELELEKSEDDDSDASLFQDPGLNKIKAPSSRGGIPNIKPVIPEIEKHSKRKQQVPTTRPKTRHNTVTPNNYAKKSGSSTELASPWKEDASIDEFAWQCCDDPWGPSGYEEGDILLFTSIPHSIRHLDALLPSNRFAVDLFSPASQYRRTHHCPREGNHGLVLKRDPFSKLHWGFTWKRHEFGGACLVEHVEDNSPASAARFVGESETSGKTALQRFDMILSINNKSIPGMSENALHAELEMPGTELCLLVSRYKFTNNQTMKAENLEQNDWDQLENAVADPLLLDWIDAIDSNVGADEQCLDIDKSTGEKSEAKQVRCATLVSPHPVPPFEQTHEEKEQGQFCPDTKSASDFNQMTEMEVPHSLASDIANQEKYSGGSSVTVNRGSKIASANAQDSPSKMWLEDKNTWSGCVCGETHDAQVAVYWVQCDSCDSWYNVSPICVGMSQGEATAKPSWRCWACDSDGSIDSLHNGGRSPIFDDQQQTASPDKGLGQKSERSQESRRIIDPQSTDSALVNNGRKSLKLGEVSIGIQPTETSLVESQLTTLGTQYVCGSHLPVNQFKVARTQGESNMSDTISRPQGHNGIAMERYLPDGSIRPKKTPVKDARGLFKKAAGRPPPGYVWNEQRGVWVAIGKQGMVKGRLTIPDSIETTGGSSDDNMVATEYNVGDFVQVLEHGWSGVNNEAGVAQIQGFGRHETGSVSFYKVKYVIGDKKAQILPPYLKPHKFW